MTTHTDRPSARSRRTPSRSVKRNKQTWLHRHSLGVLIGVLVLLSAIGAGLAFAFIPYTQGSGQWVYVPAGSSRASVRDSLTSTLGPSMGTRVYAVWRLMGGVPERSSGAYLIDNGQTAFSISRRLKTGRQTPVKVTFQGTRTMRQLAERIAGQMQFTAGDFLDACHEVLPGKGFNQDTYPAAFIPDTYEFYWSAEPSNVVKRLLDYRDLFWNDKRLAKARRLGLNKVEVATLASIVEEETAKADERPLVARLYLNRLAKGMRLQADPTVKFATGDFGLRRIRGEHLKTASPFNTYLHAGLPPGPIRVASQGGIDAVLDAPVHNYLYMCAKEDFSGYHNFATDYPSHQANARRYRQELDRRKIN